MHKNIPNYYNNLDKVYFKIWDLLCHGSVNRNSSFHLPIFISGHGNKFEFGFAVDWMRKDLKIAMEEAKKNNSPLPITKIVDGYYEEIQKMGGNRWDTSSLIRKLRKK